MRRNETSTTTTDPWACTSPSSSERRMWTPTSSSPHRHARWGNRSMTQFLYHWTAFSLNFRRCSWFAALVPVVSAVVVCVVAATSAVESTNQRLRPKAATIIISTWVLKALPSTRWLAEKSESPATASNNIQHNFSAGHCHLSMAVFNKLMFLSLCLSFAKNFSPLEQSSWFFPQKSSKMTDGGRWFRARVDVIEVFTSQRHSSI